MTLNWPALRVAALYALFGVGWAVLSEWVMLAFSPDPLIYSQIGIWKEVVFILATAFLLFLLTGKQSTEASEPSAGGLKRASVGSLILVFAVLATTIILLGLGGVAYTAGKQKEKEIERLQAISDLKVGQIVAWLEERHADAQIMRGDDSLFELYETWRATGDETARRKLMGRLEVHRDAFNYLDILLLDDSGKVVMAAGKAEHSATPNLLETARRAIATGQILSTDLYRIEDKKPARVHLDFIVPLRVAKGRPKMAVALQADPNRFLFPFIQSWPVPSASAETLLFRRDGDQVLFLNELRHRADTALKQRVPMTMKDLLAVQALEGRTAAGGMVEGVDYRPVPVLGVAKAIPGTPWFLVAKLDKSELYAQAKRDAGWITLAETLALVAAAAATILLYQRQELRFSQIQREQQADKLRAFQLLDAIAEGSTDAIYAKDATGRYLLLNRELSRFAGKTKAEILGRDDTVIFPPAEAARLMAGDRRILEAGRIETTEEMLPTIGGARFFLVTRGPLLDAEGKTIGLFGIARDITEHKYQERELQTSEARFRAIFDGVNDAILLHDAESGAIIDANARLTEMFGYSRREARHLRMDDLCANSYTHEEARQCIGRAQRGENPVFEWLARRRDGSQFWVEASLRRAEIGGRACILELVRDITDRKRAENLLRERIALQEQLTKIATTVPVVVCSLRLRPDGSSCLPYASPAIEELLGLTREELATDATPLYSRMHPDDAGHFREVIAESARNMAPWRSEFRFHHPRKGEIWIEGHSAPQQEEDGSILWHGFVTDITARRQAETTLRKLSQAVEQSPVSIMITDIAGNIEYANRKFTEVTGYSLQEVLGRNPRLLKSDETPPQIHRHLWQTIAAGGEWAGELHNRRKNGELFWEFERILPIRDSSGNITSFVAVKEDITEHKLATEEIRRLNETLERRMAERIAEIEHARREIDSFSRSVSHDLRALLLAIDGFVRTPLEAESGSLGPEERTRLDRIARNIARVRLFIEDLLEFTRLSRGDMHLCEVDMQLLAQEVLNELVEDHPVAERHLGTLPPAAGDPDMLRIVLGTLIGNAFGYCAREGKPEIEIGARQQDGATVYFVRDNGPGFDTECDDRLFGVFRRRHAQAEFPGTGIGLATVKRVIERHGGRLWAEAAVGAGVTFYFTLDSASSASAPGAVADS